MPGCRISDGTGDGLGVGGQPVRAVLVSGLRGRDGQPGERLRHGVGLGRVRASGLGVGGQPGRAVPVSGLRDRGSQPGEYFRLGVRVGDGTGLGLGVGGQPGRAVPVSGLRGRGGHPGERLRLVEWGGDGAGEGLSAVQVSGLGDRGSQPGECLCLVIGVVMVRARASASAASRYARSGSPARARWPARLVPYPWSSGSDDDAGEGLGAVMGHRPGRARWPAGPAPAFAPGCQVQYGCAPRFRRRGERLGAVGVSGLGGRGSQPGECLCLSPGSVMARARASARSGSPAWTSRWPARMSVCAWVEELVMLRARASARSGSPARAAAVASPMSASAWE